jgi:hypothetical protein
LQARRPADRSSCVPAVPCVVFMQSFAYIYLLARRTDTQNRHLLGIAAA